MISAIPHLTLKCRPIWALFLYRYLFFSTKHNWWRLLCPISLPTEQIWPYHSIPGDLGRYPCSCSEKSGISLKLDILCEISAGLLSSLSCIMRHFQMKRNENEKGGIKKKEIQGRRKACKISRFYLKNNFHALESCTKSYLSQKWSLFCAKGPI